MIKEFDEILLKLNAIKAAEFVLNIELNQCDSYILKLNLKPTNGPEIFAQTELPKALYPTNEFTVYTLFYTLYKQLSNVMHTIPVDVTTKYPNLTEIYKEIFIHCDSIMSELVNKHLTII